MMWLRVRTSLEERSPIIATSLAQGEHVELHIEAVGLSPGLGTMTPNTKATAFCRRSSAEVAWT